MQKAALLDQEYMSHWHPNLTVNLVVDQTNWIYGQVPQPLDECKFVFTMYLLYKDMPKHYSILKSVILVFARWFVKIFVFLTSTTYF